MIKCKIINKKNNKVERVERQIVATQKKSMIAVKGGRFRTLVLECWAGRAVSSVRQASVGTALQEPAEIATPELLS